jgi:nitrogen regulatory protein PII-like uncharacterized protein
MNRYWVSWYSGYYADEGCTKPPFQVWITGSRQRPNDGLTSELLAKYQKIEDEDEAEEFINKYSKDTATICALIDAESEDEIWAVVEKHFPDYKQRFIEERTADYNPGDRFGNFENKTSLYE